MIIYVLGLKQTITLNSGKRKGVRIDLTQRQGRKQTNNNFRELLYFSVLAGVYIMAYILFILPPM